MTEEERAWLAGEGGPGLRKAMEIVVALGRIYGAEDTVAVSSVQVAGVSYKNLGDAGLDFLREWAAQGARSRVPAFLNPAGMDLRDWQRLGIAESFARRQLEVIDALSAMGVDVRFDTKIGWRYRIGHREVGPLSWQELWQAARRGEVGPTTEVWHKAHGRWRPASEFPGLFT